MRWFQRSLALFALAPCVLASVASAQGTAFDVRRPKPVVMLLVDTSGSMERMPGNASNPTQAFPVCTGNPASDALQKNRWAITLEALTGTFTDFSCRKELRTESKYKNAKTYDYGYYLPHHNFTTAPGDFTILQNQATDGVIDAFAQRIKFGLMTFDGVGTTLGGDTLIPLSQFSIEPFKSAVVGAPGIYSYGRVGGLSFPGCENVYGINSGARGPNAPDGALIAVSDDGADIVKRNQEVQDALLSVRPFGGTPIAGMLDDLKFYLENDPSVKLGGDDEFAACRERYAILITDGAPDPMFRDARFQCQSTDHEDCAEKQCQCPYPTESELAQELRTSKLLKELLVIAFDVDQQTRDTLNDIAQKGGGRDVIPAASPLELRQQLSGILVKVSDDAATRSSPQIVDNGLPPYAGGQQYEITAGFRIGQDVDDPWDGLLYRRRYGCAAGQNGGPPQPEELPLQENEGDYFHLRLNQQASEGTRKIVTVVPKPDEAARGIVAATTGLSDRYRTSSQERLETTYNIRARVGTFSTKRPAPDSSIDPRQGVYATEFEAKDFTTADLDRKLFGDADGDGLEGQVEDLAKIVNYVRAVPSARANALADIYHSNPVVLPPLTTDSRWLNTPDAQLSAFLRAVATPRDTPDPELRADYGSYGRPGVVFVGTNDGVLHAFNLDNWKDKSNVEQKGGHEFWGFVPPALFNKLAMAAAPTHQEMFDGTPQIRNMLLSRDDQTRKGKYGTILLSALRGFPAYVALDITAADQPPVFLWQFTTPAMGSTVATPALAQVRILWDGSDPQANARERAIAILPGGLGVASSDPTCTSTTLVADKTLAKFPENEARTKVRCWAQRGRGLYVVDVATGQLIQEFDHQHFPSPLTGSVAVDGEGMDVSRAAYFTDEDGVLWRLSMLDPNPSNWLVEPLWDLFHADRSSPKAFKKGRPSIHPPLLSRDKSGNYVILVGTGDVDNLVEVRDSTDPFRHRLVSLTEERTVTNHVFTGTVDANWDWKLEEGESVTGGLSLFNGVLYFGSFVSDGTGACGFGSSRMWGVHYTDSDTDGGPKPMLEDGVDASTLEPRYTRFVTQDLEDSLILGVSIASEPVCVTGTTSTNFSPFNFSDTTVTADAKVGGGGFQIRAMISGKGGTNSGANSGSALNQYNRALSVPSAARFVGWGGPLE